MSKYVKINGVDFELCRPYKGKAIIWGYAGHGTHSNIYECYNRPSVYKVEIWDDWCRFFWNLEKAEWWINSHNCMMFTISAFVEWQNVKYFLSITKYHNRAYICSDGGLE